MISVKVHSSYRNVVAICDTNLIGKNFEEDIRQLHIKQHFFSGETKSFEEVVRLIKFHRAEDATFNIVGEHSIKAALEAGLIDKDSILTIQNIPFSLVLL